MSMDVYGLNPASEKGKVFKCSNRVWLPLWNYVCNVFPKAGTIQGWTNDGDGLDEVDSAWLGNILMEEIEAGRTEEFKKEYDAFIESLPDEDCIICAGTGKYQPDPAVEMASKIVHAITNQPAKEPEVCTSCNGKKKKPAIMKSYPLHLKAISDFAEFAKDSGGFRIC